MIPERYSVADVDGRLCVVLETTDFFEPTIVSLYWPTTSETNAVLDLFFDSRDHKYLSELKVSRSRPGEYFIAVNDDHYGAPWRAGRHFQLEHGSATQSIKTDKRPAPMPKVRKGIMLYWSGGRWVKHLKSGVQNIDPLTV